MTKPKKPARIALPKKGGSYVADAGTGKLERTAHTEPAEPRPAAPQADAAAPTKLETKEE
jgi:hypothetical protein|tara:strand:- start:245819 stop:245998 length:180 start_codon:yes stop_codon:yes gene_type:complete